MQFRCHPLSSNGDQRFSPVAYLCLVRSMPCAVSFLATAVLLVSCATEPPPPPVIQGRVRSVSSADIRVVLQRARYYFGNTYRRPTPICRVVVVDHNRIHVYFCPDDPTGVEFQRVHGSWTVPETQRKAATGVNVQ